MKESRQRQDRTTQEPAQDTSRKESKASPADDGKPSVVRPEEPASPKPLPPPETDPNANETPAMVSPSPESKVGTQKDERVAKPEPQNAEPENTESKPNDVEVAKVNLGPYLKEFDQAISKGDLVAACKTAERAKSDLALKPIAKEVESLGRVGLMLSEAASVRHQALEALSDGKKRTFQTKKGTVTGVVRKVEGDTLRVKVVGRINKQVIEYEKRVKVADLTAACHARLLGEKKPTTSDEWLAEAARNIGASDLDRAEKALAEAGEHPLGAHYRSRVEALRLGEREAAANREWAERIAPLLAVKKFAQPKAKQGLETLKAFRAAHGKTKYAASMAAQVKRLEETFLAVLGRPKELTLVLGEGVKMEFVLIPAGTFTMGDPKEETGGKPQHEVTLSKAYYLGKYEVTQAQYERITGRKPSASKKGPKFPVEHISWQDGVDFCKKLSEKTGTKARLPTEAEWEHACRAGTMTLFSFGDEEAKLVDYGWSRSNSGRKTHPVGQKKPNPWGLYDMHGNVSEWCQDWYGPYTKKATTDPKGAATGRARVLRGGCWNTHPGSCRLARRAREIPKYGNSSYGMRILLDF